ncbi:GNAT superfamily N-acetyltransferase [Agromyces terreus]|uniref:GNAT superfamily N-acetyltransferase n=1 Tax=Agromyces terreus TaxID=424795 RepID=A0A9X2H910_9MICO|nr:GNAT family N-acetyltransferase [Agromyces terreus]MCP2372244.1 GNAT superfamily N-acetyltransferase [Agromyces terreus]
MDGEQARSFEIRAVPVPEALGAPDSREFEAMAEVAALVEESVWGHRTFAWGPASLLPRYRDDRYQPMRAFAAWEGDRCVGRVECEWELSDGAETLDLAIGVLPDARRRGIGTALLEAARGLAADLGRDILTGMSDVAAPALEAPGARLEARDGSGSIPASDPGAAFATHHGFRLAQLERMSGQPLAGRAEEFSAASEAAEAAAADDPARYRIVTWVDHAPDHLVEGMAIAQAAMSTDPPAGESTYDVQQWDAARVRATEEQSIASGRTCLFAAAVLDDDVVAGFTELSVPGDSSATFQWSTIVLEPHRGHRLGMRLKLANLVQLHRVAPERTDVYTWNADENEHMLAINVALGYRVLGLSALWQRDDVAGADSAGTGATNGS